MLCILAVFIPSFFMQGAAQALFVPLSLAVGFAMVASYLLSSTFVPVLSVWLLRAARRAARTATATIGASTASATRYAARLPGVVALRWLVVPVYLRRRGAVIFVVGRALGPEIFPMVDAGQFQLRLRAPAGTRIEQTEADRRCRRSTSSATRSARTTSRSRVGYVGVSPPSYPINAIYQWTGGPEEAVLRVQLKPRRGVARRGAQGAAARRSCAERDARTCGFSFEPGDIVNEVMSFGSPTPIEVAVSGPNLADNRAVRREGPRASWRRSRRCATCSSSRRSTTRRSSVDIDRERAGRDAA